MAEPSTISEGTQGTDLRKDIIKESFDVSGSGGEHCDIFGKYSWTIDKFKSGDTQTIPYCYLVEYHQKHNSVITNLINSVSAALTSVNSNKDNISEGFKKIKDVASALGSAMGDGLSGGDGGNADGSGDGEGGDGGNGVEGGEGGGDFGGGLMGALDKGWEMLKNAKTFNNPITSTSGFLKPYSLLYWLEATGKKYTFPMISELPKHKLANSYGDNNADTSILSANSLISKITDYTSDIPATVRDIAELVSFTRGEAGGPTFTGTFVEKAKFFQYPLDTEEYTIQFPLINTVRSSSGTPEWKKNYKFILLFTLRNMIYRKDNAEYYPPLFYDLYIPGVVRQPYCYVSSIDVLPFGMTRLKEASGILALNGGTSASLKVPVPELWILSIKLKSLVPTSANMVLSSIYDLPINNSKK